jgi:hypothetical protein
MLRTLLGAFVFLSLSAQAKEPVKALVNPDTVESQSQDDVIHLSEDPLPQIKRKKTRIDPRYRQESRFIEHPNAEKGLIRIDKDRVYHYKVKQSEQKNAASLRFAVYEPTNLANPNDSALDFDSIYEVTDIPMLLYDQEWQFFQKFGKLGWKVGGGFYLAQGTGVFENPNPGGEDPQESFTFMVFPLNLGLVYRAHFWDGQWIIPYAEGGVDAFCFAEIRDDDNNPPLGAALGASPAMHFSVGGSIPLGRKASSFLDLDREYGINAMYISFEYRSYIALSEKYDFSGDAMNGGITVEF